MGPPPPKALERKEEMSEKLDVRTCVQGPVVPTWGPVVPTWYPPGGVVTGMRWCIHRQLGSDVELGPTDGVWMTQVWNLDHILKESVQV